MLGDDLHEQSNGRLKEKERDVEKKRQETLWRNDPVTWETVTEGQDRYIVPL